MKFYEHDKAQFEKANVFARSLANAFPPHMGLSIRARPCWRGGWRVGYRYSGNVVVIFSWIRYISKKYGEQRRSMQCRCKPTIEIARKWFCRHNAQYRVDQAYAVLHEMYRRSGFIPKHIAKKHSNMMKQKWGPKWSNNLEACRYLIPLAYKYINRYAKCPYCGARGLTENIVGYDCKKCGQEYIETAEKV